ncbi:hypothetical protein CLF_103975 [Clonorchis sinensis]|uniref:Reverse transcriptase domain-containing protein n=1 Tax=Clonorchis sinensis TaxID=79923 RepID=G7YNP2_CLOSI|nr:hypothetical protein CLF_103975 [Clonorchis sinensis]
MNRNSEPRLKADFMDWKPHSGLRWLIIQKHVPYPQSETLGVQRGTDDCRRQNLGLDLPQIISSASRMASSPFWCGLARMIAPEQEEDCTKQRLPKIQRRISFQLEDRSVSKRVMRAGEIIPRVESVFQNLPPMEAKKLRVQLVTVLKFQQPGAPTITPAERSALNTLIKVDNIVSTKADKGKATVVMNKSNYLQKVKQHLTNGPYRKINNANISSIMNRSKAEVGKYLRSVINHLGQGVTVEPDDILVSFDVNSLYTNVPKGNSLEIAKRLLLADTTLSERTQLTVDEIVKGIKARLNLTHFVFDSVGYTQEQGLTMQSPISPVLANIFMEEFEQKALCGFPHPPKVFWHYVNDTFVVMKLNKVIMNKLRGSGYPASLIRRQLRRVLVPLTKPKREWLGTAVTPYKPGTSEIIRRILNTAYIRVGFQRGNTLRSALVQLKDSLPENRTGDCIYKIKCSDCIKVYVGQTARELHTRIGEHKRKINRPPRNADEYRVLLKNSAIAEHALDTGHKMLSPSTKGSQLSQAHKYQRNLPAATVVNHHSVAEKWEHHAGMLFFAQTCTEFTQHSVIKVYMFCPVVSICGFVLVKSQDRRIDVKFSVNNQALLLIDVVYLLQLSLVHAGRLRVNVVRHSRYGNPTSRYDALLIRLLKTLRKNTTDFGLLLWAHYQPYVLLKSYKKSFESHLEAKFRRTVFYIIIPQQPIIKVWVHATVDKNIVSGAYRENWELILDATSHKCVMYWKCSQLAKSLTENCIINTPETPGEAFGLRYITGPLQKRNHFQVQLVTEGRYYSSANSPQSRTIIPVHLHMQWFQSECSKASTARTGQLLSWMLKHTHTVLIQKSSLLGISATRYCLLIRAVLLKYERTFALIRGNAIILNSYYPFSERYRDTTEVHASCTESVMHLKECTTEPSDITDKTQTTVKLDRLRVNDNLLAVQSFHREVSESDEFANFSSVLIVTPFGCENSGVVSQVGVFFILTSQRRLSLASFFLVRQQCIRKCHLSRLRHLYAHLDQLSRTYTLGFEDSLACVCCNDQELLVLVNATHTLGTAATKQSVRLFFGSVHHAIKLPARWVRPFRFYRTLSSGEFIDFYIAKTSDCRLKVLLLVGGCPGMRVSRSTCPGQLPGHGSNRRMKQKHLSSMEAFVCSDVIIQLHSTWAVAVEVARWPRIPDIRKSNGHGQEYAPLTSSSESETRVQ